MYVYKYILGRPRKLKKQKSIITLLDLVGVAWLLREQEFWWVFFTTIIVKIKSKIFIAYWEEIQFRPEILPEILNCQSPAMLNSNKIGNNGTSTHVFVCPILKQKEERNALMNMALLLEEVWFL